MMFLSELDNLEIGCTVNCDLASMPVTEMDIADYARDFGITDNWYKEELKLDEAVGRIRNFRINI